VNLSYLLALLHTKPHGSRREVNFVSTSLFANYFVLKKKKKKKKEDIKDKKGFGLLNNFNI
jgi:hypothetical protein